MTNVFKWGIVGDLQIPYEDARAVALWFKVMKSWKPDAIDIVGDIDDQLEYSTFSDGTTDEFFNKLKKEAGDDRNPLPFIKSHADGARSFYKKVRSQHKNADIHVSLGNHDVRIFKYIDKKSPDYNEQVTPELLWGLDNVGMSYRLYHEKPFHRFGGVYVHHGTSVSTTGPTVNKDIESMGISLIRGHSHKAMTAFKTYPMTGVTLQGLECGHMCDPTQYGLQYASNPDWQLGFGIGHVFDGRVQLEFIPISSDYTCVVDGRLFVG